MGQLFGIRIRTRNIRPLKVHRVQRSRLVIDVTFACLEGDDNGRSVPPSLEPGSSGLRTQDRITVPSPEMRSPPQRQHVNASGGSYVDGSATANLAALEGGAIFAKRLSHSCPSILKASLS